MPDPRRALSRLLPSRHRTCPGCGGDIPRAVDICDLCVERLPRPLRQAFYTARALRKGDHDGYRVALVRAGVWLARNPKRPGAASQTTTVKETS